jgi:hypothetical protein
VSNDLFCSQSFLAISTTLREHFHGVCRLPGIVVESRSEVCLEEVQYGCARTCAVPNCFDPPSACVLPTFALLTNLTLSLASALSVICHVFTCIDCRFSVSCLQGQNAHPSLAGLYNIRSREVVNDSRCTYMYSTIPVDGTMNASFSIY